jgi:hypothetical protein
VEVAGDDRLDVVGKPVSRRLLEGYRKTVRRSARL